MNISNDQLREFAGSDSLTLAITSRLGTPSFDDIKAMAAELLAAREGQESYLIAKSAFDKAVGDLAAERDRLRAELVKAHGALLGAGWTVKDGAEWKPPVGPNPSPLLDTIDKLRAELAEAKEKLSNPLRVLLHETECVATKEEIARAKCPLTDDEVEAWERDIGQYLNECNRAKTVAIMRRARLDDDLARLLQRVVDLLDNNPPPKGAVLDPQDVALESDLRAALDARKGAR
ncbi:MAG: hypothetical protein RIR41_1195 [Pseudomonadota bacterium]